MGFKIAIDGPSGAGKSTAAKGLAAKLGFVYIDTGAMYRAVALYFMENGVPFSENAETCSVLCNIDIKIQHIDGEQRIFLNGKDVSNKIRSREVSEGASKVSVLEAVRHKLVSLQRKLAENADVVMDGRDIGTNVLPDSQVKIFLTASPSERARRRAVELAQKGYPARVSEIEEDFRKRDYRDSNRKLNPLKKALDAVEIDCGGLNEKEVVERILQIVKCKRCI